MIFRRINIHAEVREIRKLVTEDEGILLPLNEEKNADALNDLFSNPDKCERFGKNASRKVLDQNIERYSEYFIKLIHKQKHLKCYFVYLLL